MKKLFIVRKYIHAKTAVEAIKKDKKTPVDDVWVDEEWRKNNFQEEVKTIGFKKKKK